MEPHSPFIANEGLSIFCAEDNMNVQTQMR